MYLECHSRSSQTANWRATSLLSAPGCTRSRLCMNTGVNIPTVEIFSLYVKSFLHVSILSKWQPLTLSVHISQENKVAQPAYCNALKRVQRSNLQYFFRITIIKFYILQLSITMIFSVIFIYTKYYKHNSNNNKLRPAVMCPVYMTNRGRTMRTKKGLRGKSGGKRTAPCP